MDRISDIITRVRDTLADPSGDRWSDERLLRLLDEAQKDICRHSNILKGIIKLPVYTGTPFFTLPEDLISLNRVLFDNKKLDFKSYTEMDETISNWEQETGTPKIVIFDKDNRQRIRLYPYPDTFSLETEIELSSLFGVVTGVYENPPTSNFGISTQFGVLAGLITLHYIKTPSDIVNITDELEISSVFDKAIKYYITGKALRDDMDTQNRIVGNEELQFYDRELREALKDNENSFTSDLTVYETKYKGGI